MEAIINTLYVLDLDGTLLNTNSEISEKSKEINKKFGVELMIKAI